MGRLVDASRALLRGLDVLLVALVLVAVVQASPGARWLAAAVGAALVGVHVWGRRHVRVHEAAVDGPRGHGRAVLAWMAADLALWAVLLVASPAALWLAFPLVLLQMHVLGPRRGIPLAALTTAGAVAAGLARRSPDDPLLGYVLGPAVGAVVAIGVVLGLEALVRESQARQRALDELTAAREHLAAAERDRAVAAERERLAREVHDTLAQGFTAVELLLRSARQAVGSDDTRAADLVDTARQTALDNLAEARRFVRALSPVDLADSSLPDALGRVAARTDDQGLRVAIRVEGAARPLAVPVETTLLRVAQSALANVHQHAHARRADVTLTYLEDTVLLDVVDDGDGFDLGAPPAGGGFGLPAMRSRVHELGGTLAVETAPGEGTAVAVSLPAAARDADEQGEP
ncbi:two-component sensor histidine kinase [Cellulomonas algicola]|uniref:Oxygen sensor histidine kinase NreB n=1 Tax=Cellulomonas algicola TaxID=2071633 RepID=A0A401UVM1_9CELL|nr:histidine kinase [Cellulomonas algicola]GCD18735.1 two-component sensor histidine kinase [Cellulomonas algicola]